MVARNGLREPGFLTVYRSFLLARTVWRFLNRSECRMEPVFWESGHTCPFSSEEEISSKTAQLGLEANPDVGRADEVERILAAVSG